MLPKEVDCLDLEVLDIVLESETQHLQYPADKQSCCRGFDSSIQVLQDPLEPRHSQQGRGWFHWLQNRVLHLLGMTLRQSTVGLRNDSEKKHQSH